MSAVYQSMLNPTAYKQVVHPSYTSSNLVGNMNCKGYIYPNAYNSMHEGLPDHHAHLNGPVFHGKNASCFLKHHVIARVDTCMRQRFYMFIHESMYSDCLYRFSL